MATVDGAGTPDGVVLEGRQIMLQRENVLKVFQVRKQRTVWFERTKFTLDAVIGQPWGSVFDATSGKLVKVERTNPNEDLDKDDTETEESRDNRNLVDQSGNQKLTREDIHSLKNQGASGQDIVENLIENSATFNKKTEYAQQKYIKKKKKKHTTVFTVLKPTTRLLAKMYYSRGPAKIINLRIDSISQLLTYANIHAGCRVMVAEGCIGLLLGAIMDRLQGSGEIVQFYTGTAPVRSALENFDFPKDYYNGVQAYPIDRLAEIRRKEIGESSNSNDTVTDTQSADSKSTGTESKKPKTENENKDMDTAEETSTAEQTSTTQMDTEASSIDDAKNAGKDLTEIKSSSSKDGEAENKEVEADDEKSLKRKKEEAERDERRQAKQAAHARVQDSLLGRDMDALVVALRCHPTPVVLHLLRYLAPSRPFAVFSPYKEPLLDCYMQLRDNGSVINLRLAETWLRNYQVLSNRTHPEINMSGTGGYLLTGTTVREEA